MSDYSCNRNGNKIYYSGSICSEGIMLLQQCIDNLDTEKKSTLYLSSTGGYTYSGLFMHDLIQQQNPELFSINICGFVGSAATFCLFAIPNVCIYKNATLGFHAVKDTLTDSSYPDTVISLKETERLMDVIVDIYNKKLTITKDWLERDTYLTSQQALELGIVKEII